MAELISRERELVKINNQLDQMTTATFNQRSQQHYNNASSCGHAGNSSQVPIKPLNYIVGEPRFSTYTKQKGTTTLLKKSGAGGVGGGAGGGGGAGDAVFERSVSRGQHHKERSDATFTRANANGNVGNGNTYTKTKVHVGMRMPAGNTKNTVNHGKAATNTNNSNNTSGSNNSNNNNNNNMHPKLRSPEHQRNLSRSAARTTIMSHHGGGRKVDPKTKNGQHANNISQQQNILSNTITYVKYRNPNFSESVSLDQLIQFEKDTWQDTSERPKEIRSVTSVISGTTRRMSTDNYIKFLKAQVGIYEEDHEQFKTEMGKQKELLDRTIESNRAMEKQRDQAFNLNNQLTDKLRNLELQMDELMQHNQDQKLTQSNNQQEFETVKRDVRLLKQANVNLENRLARANEDLELARKTIFMMTAAERDLKNTHRIECDNKEKQIKGLKRQRADLLNAYKKQLFMIDNLKRQNACVEQSAALGFGEKEFNKVLNFGGAQEKQ